MRTLWRRSSSASTCATSARAWPKVTRPARNSRPIRTNWSCKSTSPESTPSSPSRTRQSCSRVAHASEGPPTTSSG
eukprot:3040267-Alexandrium_andersonii.AAC.1